MTAGTRIEPARIRHTRPQALGFSAILRDHPGCPPRSLDPSWTRPTSASLPPGCYTTGVMNEILRLLNASGVGPYLLIAVGIIWLLVEVRSLKARAKEDRETAERRFREISEATERRATEDRETTERRAKEDREAADKRAKEDREMAERRFWKHSDETQQQFREFSEATERRAKEDREMAEQQFRKYSEETERRAKEYSAQNEAEHGRLSTSVDEVNTKVDELNTKVDELKTSVEDLLDRSNRPDSGSGTA